MTFNSKTGREAAIRGKAMQTVEERRKRGQHAINVRWSKRIINKSSEYEDIPNLEPGKHKND